MSARRHLLLPAAAWLLVVAAVSGGCAEKRFDYDKRGVSAVTLDRDLRACRKEAFDPHTLSIFQRLNEDTLHRCMERRGYTVTPQN